MQAYMVDIHSHLLPGIDDGARSEDDAVEMLASAYRQGVRTVFCTSHSYGRQSKYWDNLDSLQQRLQREGIGITLCCGNEIQYYLGEAGEIIHSLRTGELKTLNRTDYILVEFLPDASASTIVNGVKEILSQSDYKIVLAHVERYMGLYGNWDCVRQLLDMGCLFQVNAYDLELVSKQSIKTMARELLAKGYVTFLGSDAHRIDHHPPEVSEGLAYVYAHCDKAYADRIAYQNAVELLQC